MISYEQFEVLRCLVEGGPATQRELAQRSGVSLGSVNRALRELREQGCVEGRAATGRGIAALDPYRVPGAVILAAGAGSRLAPLSFEKPKAMFEVRGEVLIERLIGQLREAGVRTIAVVVGHMKEAFFYLAEKFDVDIVVNDAYARRGNHASLHAAEHVLRAGAYVCSSDQYYEANPFRRYEYGPVLYLDRKAARTNDPAVSWNAQRRVTAVERDRGDLWCMRGPAYLDAPAGRRLADLLAQACADPDAADAYWEDVYAAHRGEFDFRVSLLPEGLLHEFDFMSDLCAFDGDFLANVDSAILDNICATLECDRGDIARVRPVKAGLTNLSVLFTCKGRRYVYRHPGQGTDKIINRRAEAHASKTAAKLGIDGTYVHEDPEQGWKITRYVPGCVEFDYRDEGHVARAMALLRTLHESGETSPWSFDFYDEACGIESLLRDEGYPLPSDFAPLSARIGELAGFVRAEAGEPVLCHNDFYGPNLLVAPDAMHLIDWEYSAMGDYACDLGNFIAQESGYTVDEASRAVDAYFGRAASDAELLHCLGCAAIVGYYWYVWAMYKESRGNAMGEWAYRWYRAAKTFSAWSLKRYEERTRLARPLSREEFDLLVERERTGCASRDDVKRLEPYRVRRAVFLAAGFGSRMAPITVNTPKPLVTVHGTRIIDRLIDAVLAAGIEEIWIVRGYLADRFEQLRVSYPMVRFIDNPLYGETNNISSAFAARHLMQNAYVFESDLYLTDASLVSKYQYRSNYLGISVDSTDDWCFRADASGKIVALAKGADEPCWQMVGLSYWSTEDGARLAEDIAAVFGSGGENRQIFWDDVPLRLRAESYDVHVRACDASCVVEIDSFAELQRIDPVYRME